ncbi:PIN domain-like protein [Trametes elegans]|nr:PIN domain-like protein [Trametes elegans]
MGVLGLTPFLQKTCPEVIQILPNRLRSLSGKKIVIDGTLITQRFHFAPIPHPHRHVLGWYRLARHLRAANVQAVCVFDGKQRSNAKEREVERRRRDRLLVASRGSFELERLARLRRLTSFLQGWHPPESSPLKDVSPATPDRIDILAAETNPPPPSPVLEQTEPEPPSPSCDDNVVVSNQGPVPPVDHAADMSQLYMEYQRSIPNILSLTEASASSHALPGNSTLALAPDEVEEAQSACALSKSQQELITEEGEFWSQLSNSPNLESIDASIASLAEALEAKSSVLSQSYARRTYAPAQETYEQSKKVLRAMGIPCIEPSGPFEAEALAASLVLNGYADYVASEDTDVLVYEAPLLRNIASSHGPLMLIAGADVRAALALDRARFVDFALLLGTDFSQRIKNVGPARALRFIREHGSIEHILEREPQYPPRESPGEYLRQVALARRVFETLPPVPDVALLQQGEIDESAVWAILDEYHLHRNVRDDWDYGQALAGNYFSDNPAAV